MAGLEPTTSWLRVPYLNLQCRIFANNVMDRYHRAKLSYVKSDWLKVSKGALQGSVIGPFAYACNVHCNDLIVTLEDLCEIFNNGDDNTCTCYGITVPEVMEKAES